MTDFFKFQISFFYEILKESKIILGKESEMICIMSRSLIISKDSTKARSHAAMQAISRWCSFVYRSYETLLKSTIDFESLRILAYCSKVG